jgi:hypothetical protein
LTLANIFNKTQLISNWPSLLIILLLGRFAYKVIQTSLGFPNLLTGEQLLSSLVPVLIFLITLGLVITLALLLISRVTHQAFQLKVISQYIRRHFLGLVLAFLFFVIFFVLALVFNRQGFNNNNVFFAADTHQWQLRLASSNGFNMEMRAIHPLAFIFLRPAVRVFSILSGTDLFHSVILLIALTGTLSVFFVWDFINHVVGNKIHFWSFHHAIDV